MIYLDNAATTRPSKYALETAKQFSYDTFFNPSALYRYGISVQKEIKTAREFLCSAAGAADHEVIFTSCGSEADNQAIFGAAKRGTIVTTAGEHSAVFKCFSELKNRGMNVVFAPLKPDGGVDEARLLSIVEETQARFVSVVHVNNETGSINDVAGLSAAAKKINPSCVFHSDGVQAFGKIRFTLPKTIDLYAVSAHKIGGLKGTGALFKRKGLNLPPLIFGGGQENGYRSGTENVYGIKVFEYAARERFAHLEDWFGHVLNLNRVLRKELNPDYFRILSSENGSPYILTLSANLLKGEVLLHLLEEADIVVGNGSACSSRNRYSRVIEACGYHNDDGIVRISFSPDNTEEEIRFTALKLNECAQKLRAVMLS